MGGSSYDRDVYSGSSSSGWSSSPSSKRRSSYSGSSFGESSESTKKLTSSYLDASMLPNGKILKSTCKHPIVIVLDVTGSNINFARVVYDKLPMFYGQIEQKGYLDDFEISFCAVGDANYDSYPLQIGDFAKGIELDSWLEKIVLEGGGGPSIEESYELAAYYLLEKAEFDENAEPIIFFIADEKPYSTVSSSQAIKLGIDHFTEVEPFEGLRRKVNDNVFVLLNKLCGSCFRDDITNCWKELLAPQHVIKINEEKAIIDLLLGIISLVSTTRTLDTYKDDMRDRGQTTERIEGVSKSLSELSTVISANPTGSRKSTQRGKRI